MRNLPDLSSAKYPYRATGFLVTLPTLVALTLVIACGEDTPTEPPVATTISIAPPTADLSSLGEMLQLIATVSDQYGQSMVGAPVSWSGSDDAVITVSAGGLLTAVQNGNATVTATSGGASGTVNVTVLQRPARIDVTPSGDTLFAVADTVQLAAASFDANDNPMPDAEIAWSSGDDAVATVDSDGLVTATGNGDTNITATVGSATGSANVTVSQIIVGMNMTPRSAALFAIGDTVRFVASGVDANGYAAPGIVFTWSSSNVAVATVDSTGLVTAVSTGGTAVAAVSEEYQDTVGVAVTQLASEVRVTPAVDTLTSVGDTIRLSVLAVDRNGNEVTDTDYIWSNPHPAVVTVDVNGLVTATGPGTGEIRVKATRAGANYVGTATITVLASGSSSTEDGAPDG